jgi:Tubulin-tyrosine ligase family
MEKKIIKANSSIKEKIQLESVACFHTRPVLSRPHTTFTSVPIKLVKYGVSRPFNSRGKFLESLQNWTIICNRCKKLKPNTFLRESQVSPNKICDCSTQIHSIKIQKPQEKKVSKHKSHTYEQAPLFAEGKGINSINYSPCRIQRFISDVDSSRIPNEPVVSSLKIPDTVKNPVMKLKYLIFKGNNSELIKDTMKKREQWVEGYYCITSTVSFIWQPTSTGIKFDRLKPYLPVQLINHFENHFELSNKINLYRNLSKYCKDDNISIKTIVPETFALESKSQTFKSQLEKFKNFFQTAEAIPNSTQFCGKNLWILKPSSFNRGRGIQIINKIDQIDSYFSNTEETGNYVIQKYIESPMLFYNRKFDVRMWVLITHENLCYYYPHGYIRTSSEIFSIEDNLLNNKFIHLTNNAVQKQSEVYGKYEKGNQVSFSDFSKYLKDYHQSIDFGQVLNRIVQLITISFKSVQNKLNPRSRQHCFELFGYDFIIDSDIKPWLIEVNTNPCLELSSPLLAQLIPKMIEEAFNLTVDKIFPVTKPELEICTIPANNSWELINL